MNFLPVFLWTDLLLFLLLAVCGGYARHAARHAHLRAPWVRVRQNPVGMASATLLAAFALIGVLDSLHYRPALEAKPGAPGKTQYSVEVRSVLDLLAQSVLGPMAGKSEKTYSAPLATHGFSREAREVTDDRDVVRTVRSCGSGQQAQSEPTRFNSTTLAVPGSA